MTVLPLPSSFAATSDAASPPDVSSAWLTSAIAPKTCSYSASDAPNVVCNTLA
jgi:hypothetical protein